MSKNGMKIAIASSGLGHVARGMEAWAESLAAALHEQGIDITLFRGAGPAESDYDIILPCIKRSSRFARIGNLLNHIGGWRIGLGSEASVESFSYGIRLLWHLRRGYDLIHVQQGSLALFLDRAEKLGLLDCSIIFGNGQKAPPEFLSRFPYLHFLSPYGMEEVTDHVEKQSDWCVIPNFVDTEVFSPGEKTASREAIGLPQDRLIILSVGMVEKQVKRMDYFLREAAATAACFTENIHFVIAGSRHSESREIEQLGKDLLGDKFSVLFDLDRIHMPSLYRSADIFVLCSPREAMPVALIEAMSCGLPAICHEFPVMEWIVGKGGTCINMKRDGQLHTALMKYCSEQSLRESIGQAARERVTKEYSKGAVISQFIQFYKNTCNARKSASVTKEG